jgi:SAM-dependent methyltransferase
MLCAGAKGDGQGECSPGGMLERIAVRAVLGCPECKRPLAWRDSTPECTSCGTEYAMDGAIPILMRRGDAPPTVDARWARTLSPKVKAWLQPFLAKTARLRNPPLTYKTRRSRDSLTQFVRSFPPDAVILNIGSGTSNYGRSVINLDIAPRANVDVVAIAEALPIRTGACDGVILMAVLEHVEDAASTLCEAQRVLRAGGRALVDVPFIQGYHSAPGDFRRYTEQGLREEMERHGFEIEGSGVAVGPASSMAWVTAEFVALLLSGRSALAYRVIRPFAAWASSPIRFADVWLERHPMASRMPSAVWVVARKRTVQQK